MKRREFLKKVARSGAALGLIAVGVKLDVRSRTQQCPPGCGGCPKLDYCKLPQRKTWSGHDS